MNISIKSRINFEYILCYPLLGNKNFQKIIDQVKQKLNLPVVCVQTIAKKRVKADYYIYDASPNEFLDLIRNSKFVLTSSFHGTAFSIIFEKPFYTLIKDYKPQRMENLTNLLGLEDRIIRDKIKEIDVNIDYKTVNNKLSSEREKSLLYLKEMIKK